LKTKIIALKAVILFLLLGVSLSIAEPIEVQLDENTAKCKAELTCAGGGKVSCEGKKVCKVNSWSVDCDGVMGYC
jgi:hypothetical protein